ncbi:MAG: phosphate ABC transporter permease PstA [Eubacteriales bacterium]|jgi:phosphate transport system permease protein|nr:phosphate ABC transporter permease PstA [Eubacteriales bacterium]
MKRSSNLTARKRKNTLAHLLFASSAFLSVIVLVVLLVDLFKRGLPYLDLQFFTSFPSRFAEKSGILPAILGSVWIILLTSLIAIPVSIGAAIYLEEYAEDNRLTRLIKVNISNLAGIPSIVYGILGLTVFVRALSLGRTILSGALTMSLLIMPVLIVASQEAIHNIPDSLRHGSYALGATKWQTIRRMVLPSAMPGILTGIILAVSRALGESAPLLLVGAFAYIGSLPKSPMDAFIVLPIQIYTWMSKPSADFKDVTAAAILVLLALLLLLNLTAIIIRNRNQRSFE